MIAQLSFQTLIFYQYTTIDNPEALMERERAFWKRLDLRGRMTVAKEGINGTLEGTMENAQKYVEHILKDVRFKHMKIKRSVSAGDSFPRMVIKVRDEIVGTHLPEHINPRQRTATHLTPKQVNQMFEKNENFVVVDMRNSYEIQSGKFIGTIDPGMKNSRELPQKVDYIREQAAGKKILAVCTAGVRCEKMSAFLLDQGFKDVCQLEGGIHSYIQAYPGLHFEGTLFTFDNRLTMDFTNKRKVIGKCKRCENKSENYINCANGKCHLLCIVCGHCTQKDGLAFCSQDCAQT